MFMYGGKNIPSVGAMELGWVNTPLPPVRSGNKAEADHEEMLGTGHPTTNGDGAELGAAEVDYDVAEEDDRWMAG